MTPHHHFPLLLLLLLFLPFPVNSHMEDFHIANAPHLNDMGFTQHITSNFHPVRSLLDCLRQCVAAADRKDQCKAFTYVRGSAGSPPSPSPGGLCQGYSKRKAAGDAHVGLPHARMFVLPVPPIPDWISTSCGSGTDCVNQIPESDLYQSSQLPICYKRLCLCGIGYFYSVSQKLCVSSCPGSKLQPTYRLYPGSGMYRTNDYTFYGTLSYCQERCSALPDCQNFEKNGDQCHAARVSGGKNFRTSDEPWNYYQRDCA